MAIMREVNRAIKNAFPGKDIEAVAGAGYIYFSGDDGFDKIKSIYINPRTTATCDVIAVVLTDIRTAINVG